MQNYNSTKLRNLTGDKILLAIKYPPAYYSLPPTYKTPEIT